MLIMNNLKLRQFKGQGLADYKSTLVLTYEQREALFGILLGKGSISIRRGLPVYSIKFEYTYAQKAYAFFIYNIMCSFIGGKPKVTYDYNSKPKTLWFRTYSHVDFIDYFYWFYTQDGISDTYFTQKGDYPYYKLKKLPPFCYFKTFLTDRCLAFWFMESGSVDPYTGFLFLRIDYWLSFNDQDMIAFVFKENFNLSVSLEFKKKGAYGIIITCLGLHQSQEFLRIIKPFLFSDFLNLLGFRKNIL